MKKIIDGRKYDTDRSLLVGEWKNGYLKHYERELAQFFEEHPELKPETDLPSPPIYEDEDPWFQEDEPDFDWTDKSDPEDKGGSELEEDDDDDFEFLSSNKPRPLADDFDFDSDEPRQPDDDEEDQDDPELQEPTEEPDFDFDKEEDDPEPEQPIEDEEPPVWPILSPRWRMERLYKKDSTGEWYLVVFGGRLSGGKRCEFIKFPEYTLWHNTLRGTLKHFDKKPKEEVEKMHPSTYNAFAWACDHLSVDEVEAIFGEVKE